MNKKEKNILIVACSGLGNSGVPRVIVNTIDAAIEEYNFDVVVFNDDDFFYSRLKSQGVNIIHFNEPQRAGILNKITWHLFKKYSYYKTRFSKLISEKKYHAVHSFREDESWPIFKIAKKCGVKKLIWHQNTITTSSKWYLRLYKKINSKITKKYTTDFVGVSLLTCEKTFPEKKYTIIHNGYDESKYNNKKPYLSNSKTLSITHVATFSSNKNQLFSIEILKCLLALYPNSTLNLVGEENEAGYYNKIIDKINELGLKKQITIFKGNSDISKIYSITTFTLLPSLSEGAPLVTIESQASGIKMFVSKAITDEMNCGGLMILDLNDGPQNWAKIIFDEFIKSGNSRTIYDVKPFSNEKFVKSVINLYHR